MNEIATKFLFFTGKGGVGKTSLSCATAVKFASEGNRVLLISTDPASNLEDVLGTKVSDSITSHKDLAKLHTININPEIASEEYRSRVIAPLKEVVSSQEINKITEGLSGACTTEIASFDEFSRFITGEGNPEKYDYIIFDTAPTGHTIRLLELPAAWDGFLENNPNGASCIGPSSALKSSKERYKKVMNSLRDSSKTTFFLVARPDEASLKEAARTSLELKELGLQNQELCINGVFSAINNDDAIAVKIALIAKQHLEHLPQALQTLNLKTYPLLPYNVLGIEKLNSLFDKKLQSQIIENELNETNVVTPHSDNLIELVNTLELNANSGLIMTMGKGGVGKTIVAASIATMLAQRGHSVLLTTTDPAAHVTDFINQLEKKPETLTVERIDPKVETQNYINKILEQKGKGLDDNGKRLLLEDLQSPCTEEVAVFHAFTKAINKAKRQFVVMDTAPTGHTLLLLDTTGSYHKEVLKNNYLNPSKISTPYMLLQNADFAKILLVSLPETTPMREAEVLQNDLKRAGIKPYAWLINQCLSSLVNLKDPILRKRASNEVLIIQNIKTNLADKVYSLPYITDEKILPTILNMNKL